MWLHSDHQGLATDTRARCRILRSLLGLNNCHIEKCDISGTVVISCGHRRYTFMTLNIALCLSIHSFDAMFVSSEVERSPVNSVCHPSLGVGTVKGARVRVSMKGHGRQERKKKECVKHGMEEQVAVIVLDQIYHNRCSLAYAPQH